jgi:hypothetical protein|tara:strand:- start:78 stop:350 length:273 start_codon:yes stop_codon:yes gene_type:complete
MKDAWRSIAVAAVSCLTLMIGFWLVEAREYVSRAEVTEMIKTQSPYVADRQLILSGMENLSRTLEENNKAINGLNVEIARLRAELDKIRE